MKNLMEEIKAKKKILIVASVPSMIESFNMDNIHILKKLGFEVHVACNFDDLSVRNEEQIEIFKKKLIDEKIYFFNVPFTRSINPIYFITILKSYKLMKQLLSQNDYYLLHCHTPIASVISRLAGKKFKKKNLKIIYTAHGFHFYKGGPLISWILFYPVEKYLSRFTNILLTINKDDYLISQKFHAKKKIYIRGVGININKFQQNTDDIDKLVLKKSLNIPLDCKILISIGELNKNKNHVTAIRALSKLPLDFVYIICGSGKERVFLETVAKQLGVLNRVFFLGHINNVETLLSISDLMLFMSKREGLGLAGLESFASGVPIISTGVGGIKDYLIDGENGYAIENPKDFKKVAELIERYFKLDESQKYQIKTNCIKMSENFDRNLINKDMEKIYLSFFNESKNNTNV